MIIAGESVIAPKTRVITPAPKTPPITLFFFVILALNPLFGPLPPPGEKLKLLGPLLKDASRALLELAWPSFSDAERSWYLRSFTEIVPNKKSCV
jgi:hypothetical protein